MMIVGRGRGPWCEAPGKRVLGIVFIGLLLATSAVRSPRPSRAAPSQSELRAAETRLMELEKEFELVVERYNLVHERLTAIQIAIGKTEREVKRLTRRMAGEQKLAVAIAQQMYKSGGSTTAVEAVLSAGSIADINTRLRDLNASEEVQAQVFERLAVDRKELDAKLTSLEEGRAKAARAESELVSLREDIESKLEDQKDEIADLNAKIEAARRRAEARAEAAAAAAAVTAPAVPAPTITAKASNPNAQAAVDAALSQVGKPYQWGAAGPDSYDCSGLTMWAWAHAGVSLPHNSGAQYSSTARVAQGDWEPGDLLFFGSPIHHVGMYIGGGEMVEAPYTGGFVQVSSAMRSDYAGAGRP